VLVEPHTTDAAILEIGLQEDLDRHDNAAKGKY
jgi:hypothetical protein